MSTSGHFATGRSDSSSSHILNTDYGICFHEFQAGFQEQFLHKGVTHLNSRTFVLRLLTQFFAGKGSPMDAIAAGTRTDSHDRITHPFGDSFMNSPVFD
ncbi:hypothetical protein SDC9_82084 [bioreactor metagenome]|uniref:Uncharacterized protein n=1 Tax=bioreactor metagenome TaxID=1076179 RepID=A0A644Z659_9ZZZZ